MNGRRAAGGALLLLAAGAIGCGGRSVGAPEGITVGKALPLPSGACTITSGAAAGASPVVTTARWDAVGSTFWMGTLYARIDGRGLVVERGDTDTAAGGPWRHVIAYDEHGVTRSFIYEWQGVETPADSYDQVNGYGDDGRLASSTLTLHDGNSSVAIAYQYDGHRLMASTRTVTFAGGTTSYQMTYTWDGDHVRGRVYSTNGSPVRAETRSYDGDGRLVRLDSDGDGIVPSVDGTTDIRLSWSYDGQGRVRRLEQDGTTALDAPSVDGVPDEVLAFDSGCADIAILPDVLYRLPSWLALH